MLLNFDEPFARSALWSRRLAIFALPVLVIAIMVQRTGEVDIASAFAGIGAALALAVLAIVLGIGALAVIWIRGYRGAGAAVFGVMFGALLLAYPAFYVVSGWRLPAIHDITTDPADPPAFDLARGERTPAENSADYPGDYVAIEQLSAYPEIAPIRVPVAPDEAHALALEIVNDRGWRVLDSGLNGPEPRRRIEAVATSTILRLQSDVVIRVMPEEQGARVDMRSASRLGDRDFGANAERVRDFLDDLANSAR